MKTCICDFCKKNEATRQYKVMRKYLVFPHTTEKVDMCDDCYIALFVKKGAIETKDRLWIPVEKMRPASGQKVMAFVSQADPLVKHNIILTEYHEEKYWSDGNILAWMPLPEPYPYRKEEAANVVT